MQNTEIKQKIITELNKNDFPNLEFMFSEEVLNISLDLLREFLAKEKIWRNFETKKWEFKFWGNIS